METIRQQKIQSLLHQEIGEIFRKNNNQIAPNTLLTVTKVKVTKDLSIARVHISIFGNADKIKVLDNIKKNYKQIRYTLGIRIGKQLRVVPELEFYEDNSLDYIENIDRLLKE